MELVVVLWAPGPLIRIEWPGPATIDLRRPSGLPVDPSDPDVAALIDAYEAVLAEAPPDDPAIAAAHAALLETASLLRCAPPVGPAEREYVRRRTLAITELAEGLRIDPLSYLRDAIEAQQATPTTRPRP